MSYEQFIKLDAVKHNRLIKSLVGMNRAHFDTLVPAFAIAYDRVQLERLQRGDIKQVPSGGSKGYLDTFDKKLFFLLYYLKNYPVFDVLGFHFGLSGGHAHTHVEALLPVLQRALWDLGVLPARSPGTPEEFTQLVEQYGDIAIDGMECACVRPQDEELQKARYSGKKKRHTLKALTVSTRHRHILFLFCFFAGSHHDYALMKKVFNPKLKWFHQVNVWLDLGFQGAAREYGSNSQIILPHKRPKKSKNNPKPKLTAAQVKHNQAHARIRVAVEHAIGGMKAFHCLTHRIRNHLTSLIEYLFWLPAGLWNLKIA